MELYADSMYYREAYKGIVLPEEEMDKYLSEASRHIDVLTFNRIDSINELTEFQKDAIQYCCCKMAEFEYENEDILNSPLQSYSINGVSMSFGDSWNITIINGIAVPRAIYNILRTTGLCCLVAR